jgi:hypothetical protein
MSRKKIAGKTQLAPPLSTDVPDGAPKLNPLTADDYAALEKVNANLHILADALARAHNIGLEVGMGGDERTGPAASYDVHHGIMTKILKNYPAPAMSPLDL